MYSLNTFFSFFQVTGSAFRPLTNIPHCCTKNALGFFQTQCGRSTSQSRLRLLARKDITFSTTHRDKN